MNEIIGLTITRAAIEQKSISRIQTFFHELTKNGLSAYQSVIFIFDGYDDTTEQIYEIKEVRNWVYSLFLQFPHFLYFVNPQIDTHITLLACLGNVETLLVGNAPLTPKEYDDLRVDMISQAPRYFYHLSVEDDLFTAMEYALKKYGRSIDDMAGAQSTIEMLRGVTNR